MFYILMLRSNKGMSKTEGADEVRTSDRVLVLGLDGATLDIIEPLARSGRLPRLARLMEEGAWGVLESTLPPVTIPAWVSMMTGKNPGRLGVYDLLRRQGYGIEPNGHCYSGHAPLWHTLNQYGIRTGVMNLPGTYPPDEVDGFMVTGMLTPSKKSAFSYPPTLGADLDSTVLDYEIDVHHWQYFDEDIFIKDIYKVTEKRGQAAEYLIKNIPCDFYMVVFTSSDRLHHQLWHKRDVVEAYWEELDRVVGRILDLFGEETTVIVVSDHGFGHLERTFFVNEWLNRKGFLRVKREINERFIVKFGRFIEGLYHFLGERKLVRPAMSILNKVVSLDKLQKYMYEYLSNERLEGRVNWGKTKAFSCVHTPHFGQIYINMEDKMGEGCVSEEERNSVREALMEELRGLRDPRTEDELNVEAYFSEDIYAGPHLEEAPDIVFVLDDGRCEIDAKVGDGRLFAEGAPLTGWKGTHTKGGVFMARGPGIKPGVRVEKATILDVTPTILHIFGIPQPEDVDGRVLDEIFLEDAVFSEKRVQKVSDGEKDEISGLDEEEKALIEARLKKLGYIS
jgi:predicted AlkP superfamily phosphohydrolase/phosphomutase